MKKSGFVSFGPKHYFGAASALDLLRKGKHYECEPSFHSANAANANMKQGKCFAWEVPFLVLDAGRITIVSPPSLIFDIVDHKDRQNSNRDRRNLSSLRRFGMVLLCASFLLAAQFYWGLGFYRANNFIGRKEESEEEQVDHRADLLRMAIQSLPLPKKRALLQQVLEDDPQILQNGNNPQGEIHPTPCLMTDPVTKEFLWNNDSSTDNAYLIPALESLTAEKREDIINAVYGKEYRYRLTCPNYEDTADILKAAPGNASRSVILGYHIGMLYNWREIVKDQLNTLFQCGLGAVADHMFISYSNNSTVEEELHELKSILNKYSFARDATILYNDRQPIEGVAINSLHEECTLRVQSMKSPHSDTIAYYFHTKGSSKYSPDWESFINEPRNYSHSLYWRKYMEYFTIERPYLCMKQVFDDGKYGCGVKFHDEGIPHYSGNFWATSCRYLSSIEPLTFFPLNDEVRRFDAENYISNKNSEHFGSLSQVKWDLYVSLVHPRYFSEYSKVWHPEDVI
jgi:hypothetical protein